MTAPPIICALFWPRATKQAAILAPVIGMAVLLYTIFVKPNYMGMHPGFWGFTSALVAFVVISLLTPKSRPETIERIHGTIARVYGKSVNSLWYPTKPGNILCAVILVFQVFAICYGLERIRSTTLVFGMAPQFAWVVMWWIVSLGCMFYLFKNTQIDESVCK